MLAAYGVDVLDPATTCRRVHLLLERVPPQMRRGGEHWSTEAELLAGLIDHVAQLTWVLLRVNGSKAGRPKPVPRPRPRPVITPAAPAAPAARREGTKADSWAAGLAALAGMPGVKVSGGG